MGFVSWFYVEAKAFELSVAKGCSVLRLLERSLGFFRVAFLGKLCGAWLKSTVELVRNPKAMEFIKSFREEFKAFIIQRGSNRSCWYLEVWCTRWVAAVDSS